MSNSKTSIERVTLAIEAAIDFEMRRHTAEPCRVTHYGANDIHPRHLVYWIVVRSDAERDRLRRDTALNRRLRDLLVEHGYPIEGRSEVHIGFESHETVNREAGGDFWRFWK